MVIISYIIKHIITNKNKILHKLFYALFAPYNKKKWKKYRICFRIHTEFYIYHLRKYRMNLRFTFYESLQAQCSKQEYKFVYKILYPIYSQSKKNDQKTDYRIITVSDRFHPCARRSACARTAPWLIWPRWPRTMRREQRELHMGLIFLTQFETSNFV